MFLSVGIICVQTQRYIYKWASGLKGFLFGSWILSLDLQKISAFVRIILMNDNAVTKGQVVS
jgi:hypothetical protein